MMSSSKQSTPFSQFLQENDFVEIARKARTERLQQEEQTRIEAAKPKITEEDVQAAERRGIEQGIEQGKQEALNMLRAEMETNVATMRAKFDELEPIKLELAAKLEADTLKLVQHVITHIAQDIEKNFNKDLLQAAIKTGIMSLQDGLSLNVRVHPESKSYLLETAPDILSSWNIQWKEDKNLAIGHCLFEWENQGLDINFKQITQEVDSLLQGAIAGAQHHYEEIHNEQPSKLEPQAAEKPLEEASSPEESETQPPPNNENETL